MNELLKPTETKPRILDTQLHETPLFNEGMILKAFETSKTMLERLRPKLSRKLYFSLEEKIEMQKKQLEELLGITKNKAKIIERYSNILDSQYFEQKFFRP